MLVFGLPASQEKAVGGYCNWHPDKWLRVYLWAAYRRVMNNLIDSISPRIEVSSITDALSLYQGLAGVDEAPVLEFPGLRLAVVGPFLLIEGDAQTLEKMRREATLHVNDLEAAVGHFVKQGGSVIDGPTEAAGGVRTIVQDRDGNVFECFHRPVT